MAVEFKKEHINFFIMTMVRCDKKPKEIYDLLYTAWGEEMISDRRVRQLAQQFKDGERETVKRKDGSGRPRDSRTPDNVTEVRQLLEDDPHLSKSALSNITNISESSIQRIIVKDLNLHSVSARWIPHTLSDVQKLNRTDGARRILQKINGSIMVIDEKWLYKLPMPPVQNMRAWVGPAGDRPEVPRRIISDEKYLIIVACNFRGEHYFEVIPRGTGINAEVYCTFLQHMMDVRRRGNLKIMHDNARPHKARMTENFLEENGIDRLPQPPYSPDMNLLDRFIFRNMEAQRKDYVIADINDARRFVENYLNTFSRRLLTNELANLRMDLQRIIDNGGSYL